ncbi:peptide synthase [Burkholderia pseudomallei]|nr:peptide synthase [Burkholderia pseudomallei]AYX28162.1 peptide synthase [Burkholderia pseudomallei]MBG1249474.1 peptide synthase [Burkholderia pseudomallei]MPT62286.1 peptide synthase [Burkholderia pseudomallei]MPT70996.1 peptide synthase [Burkholderia pseudomallei]
METDRTDAIANQVESKGANPSLSYWGGIERHPVRKIWTLTRILRPIRFRPDTFSQIYR